MFTIHYQFLDTNGEVEDQVIAAAFNEREEAIKWLDKKIADHQQDAGYDKEQDYWWTRDDGVVTRYTIGV